MTLDEIKDFLDEKVEKYNTPDFITDDPISIPHRFSLKEDIEIAGFLASTIAWGKRSMIIKSANTIMSIMGDSPYDFVMEHSEDDLAKIEGSIHRTFNSIDLRFFVASLRNIYANHGGLEAVFSKYAAHDSLLYAIHKFKSVFFEIPHERRTIKHIGDPLAGSAAKKINMFLRWMIRDDSRGVDFGIWKEISPSILSCPLDVHSGNVARKLGLLKRKQNDAKALVELDACLRKLDAADPVKYDFALFGLGVYEGF
ncbi:MULTISPECIES: TIGR02757 family protein [unclassified Carboxylicivirga]|uniref:TIGR02757 family protein n=1 Tax=Carboxylicivirga TaxID=1628153 RepID=UPI003D328D43